MRQVHANLKVLMQTLLWLYCREFQQRFSLSMTQAGNTISSFDSDVDWVVRGASEAGCKEMRVRAADK